MSDQAAPAGDPRFMQSALNATEAKEIEFTATKEDFVKAALLDNGLIPRRSLVYVLVFVVIFGLPLLKNKLNFAADIGSFVQIGASLLTFIVLFRVFVIPSGARRNFLKSPLAQETQSLTIAPDQILIRSARGEVRLRWKDLVAWKAKKYVTLLYTNPRMYLVIPSRLAEQGPQIEFMHSGLTAALGPAKR
jgi:hypothetical protein